MASFKLALVEDLEYKVGICGTFIVWDDEQSNGFVLERRYLFSFGWQGQGICHGSST